MDELTREKIKFYHSLSNFICTLDNAIVYGQGIPIKIILERR